MPEGPEIKRAADRIASVLTSQTCSVVVFGPPLLSKQADDFIGQTVISVKPRGKAMVLIFANGKAIYSHNQLYGKWIVLAPNEPYESTRQLRIKLVTDKGEARLYSASDIDIVDASAIEQHPFIRKLGPDILDDDVDDTAFLQRFYEPRWQRKRLGSLLLDQGFIAGTGNYLRSEILFECGLHPNLRLADLTDTQKANLAAAVRQITQRSYATGGYCLSTQDTARLRHIRDDYEYIRFAVFGHEGRACIRCNGKVEKLQYGGRRLYLCPSCQPLKT